ncbi:YfbM family protein [Catenuloplanes sp. NPDC051500]|uniref:YfbM family protein n=1 Tax=Catenuloplanes sp. NPDC051500 TaxID=3363959 RepID=UPI0037AA5167
MSINGNWLRVSPDECERARNDLDWAHGVARAERGGDSGRWAGTGKAWNGFDFLLDRLGFETPLVLGAESFVELPDVEPDSAEMFDFMDNLELDWGYGPPSYLTPAQVAAAASQLAELTEDDLLRGVDPSELQRADVYPGTWDRPGELSWVTHCLPDVQAFFTAAAKDGDAVICWLD